MLRNFITAVVLIVCSSGLSQEPVYLDYTAPLENRVEDALQRMTLEEKVKMVHAQSKFSSAGVPRLGIPELWCTDGPHGIRPEVFWDEWNSAEWTNDSCTAFPALTCLAAAWRPELAREYGRAIGEEARYRRKDILLGPGVNMMRTPLNGRSFEYMGEDPFLTSAMVVPYIQGVQSNNVAACVKHFALNNNEDNRLVTNVHVGERALHEIYLKPFKAAVEGGAWAIMPAYNLFENRNCCESPRLLRNILKHEWGFDGVAVSDWGGVHDTDAVLEGGLDLEMGTGTDGVSVNMNAYDKYYMADPYLERLRDGRESVENLDDRVRRILRTIFRTSMSPSPWKGRFTCPEHYATARKIGGEGIVLLKNNGILPLKEGNRKILVVGENAVKMMTVGGGSASLKVQREITPLTGLKSAFQNAEIDWERGYIGAGSTVFDNVKSLDLDLLTEERTPDQLRSDVVKKAKDADVVIFIGGLNHSLYQDTEGTDRKTLQLPYGQDDLISSIADINPNLVVINISGTPVSMPWADKVAAIVQSWYLGSEAGNCLADVLAGKVNPSGKLPFTFPKRIEDLPVHGYERRYPGIKRADSEIYDIYYDEGILIGYRWYDYNDLPVLFPFGYGLSYTDFSIGKPAVCRTAKGYNLKMDVSNTGSLAGAETVQVYVSAPGAKGLLREKKKLVGFSKIDLAPGETRTVSIDIPLSSLAYYDENTASEHILNGKYVFSIGSSSADLPHKTTVKYNSATDRAGNPCLPGAYADPEGIVYGDRVFIYPTRSLPFEDQTAMDCFSTRDLKHWTKHENIIDTVEVKWAWGAMWAPAVLEKDGKYYLFFGANDVHEGEIGGIGVAVSDKPEGPFKDLLGRPLINEIVNGAQPIDQFVFHDKDGSYYMYYGGWGHCNMVKLADDFTTLVPFPDGTLYKEVTPEDYTEGPFMLFKDGKYYFMWSEGDWTKDDYRVAYAIADSPLGPFERIGTILESDSEIGTGAGHHSVILSPKTGRYYIVYHRHPLGAKDGNDRVTCIDELCFDSQGRILPVKMTVTGPVVTKF